jgi:NAD(P)-dependent dehydrogenase (short-subunit alcohol dehydrogenase family)
MTRSVLITGASSGIGLATAQRLAARGFDVFGTSRNPSTDADPTIHWVAMDVGDEASVAAAVEQVRSEAGTIDGLVCNAGFGIFGSIEEVSQEAALRQFDTNVFGVLRTLRAVVPRMREARAGRIVLVGSLAAHAPIPYQAHYSASKAAVGALALGLRSELQAFGIAVSLVEPGDVDTPFNDAMDWSQGQDSAYGDSMRRCEAAIREMLPKAPKPERVASVIEDALTSARPRVRYSAGADATLVPIARRLLPDWLMLRLTRSRYEV